MTDFRTWLNESSGDNHGRKDQELTNSMMEHVYGSPVVYWISFTDYGKAAVHKDGSITFTTTGGEWHPKRESAEDDLLTYYFRKGVLFHLSKDGTFSQPSENWTVYWGRGWSSKSDNRKPVNPEEKENLLANWLLSRKNERKMMQLEIIPAYKAWMHNFRGVILGHHLGIS